MNKNSSQRTYLYFGGYYSYHFSGVIKGKGMDFNDTFERTETGLVYGFGVEMMSVFVSVNFKYGLSNIMKDKNIDKFTSRATYFSIGYMF
jgi:hypothetical protein